ncbi:MAG: hypothetical protein ACP5HF_01560 [Candidatus Micrarchaeia archaeon]|jgi:hypothetical protein
MRYWIYLALFSILLASTPANAYFNVTYLNTTVILENNTDAHVIEVLTLFISNSSVQQYLLYRQAINLTVSKWGNALGTSYLIEHIINPNSSISRFTFLPGPVMRNMNGSGMAYLTMDYYVGNVTTKKIIAPRKFEYIFNNKVFNFMHTASGEALYPNSRLNIIIPKGAEVISIYPAPDFPSPSALGNYAGYTEFSWFSGEPLSRFTFSYIVTESPQQEVLSYFQNLMNNYGEIIYAAIIIIIAATIIYLYVKIVLAR